MNRTARSNYKFGISSINNGASYASKKFDVVKGECVNSSKRRAANGKKPWQGAKKQPPKNIADAVAKAVAE